MTAAPTLPLPHGQVPTSLQTVERSLNGTAPRRRIALLLTDLNGGGVQKMTLSLAGALVERGHEAMIVLYSARGVLNSQIPPEVALHHLKAGSRLAARLSPLRADPLALPRLLLPVILPRKPPPGLKYLPSLARFLQRQRPDALISAAPNCNLAAVWANRLAGGTSKVLISERTAPSKMLTKSASWRTRHLPALMHRTYQQADVVVAVSRALGDDLAAVAHLPRERVVTIYNPVVGPSLGALAKQPVEHPWFAPGAPPVILSAGRLSAQKDFPTLIRAFAALRARRQARLVILGGATAEDKTEVRQQDLVNLAESLGVADDLCLMGFIANPYAYMARARLFALSSAWEGFGNVLVEALACGCPVVSTDCPFGPAEILDGGRYGQLVPVGASDQMAEAMADLLARPPDPEFLRRRSSDFTVRRSVEGYLGALFGTVPAHA
jgi:glycosyltransferase involved in cell wall biosynthesis